MIRERVQMLRDMIAGIPEKQINLCELGDPTRSPCNTIACIAGWAWIYPPFVEAGIRNRTKNRYDQIEACHRFFGTKPGLFTGGSGGKSEALRRLDALLK